jgi:sugar/nucleoside kinase (ribokinase family)
MKVAAMTLGAHGALARVDGQFVYAPAYVVDCVDTTGAGDVFHGAFCYAVLQGMTMLPRWIFRTPWPLSTAPRWAPAAGFAASTKSAC